MHIFEFPSTTETREGVQHDLIVMCTAVCAGVVVGFSYYQGVVLTVNIMPVISRTHLRHISLLELAQIRYTQVTSHIGTKQTQSTP